MAVLMLIFSYLYLSSFLPPITAGDPYYQFLQFVLKNPQSVNRAATTQFFTVHGLWPTNSTGISDTTYSIYIPITTCPINPPFHSSMFSEDTRAFLDLFWINYDPNRSNQDFWDYEYNTHGSCTILQMIAPLFYFIRAYEIWDNNKLNEWFAAKSISENTLMLTTDFESAIITGFGKRPRLKCDEWELQEVILCYDASGENKIDCPLYEPSCSGYIEFVR